MPKNQIGLFLECINSGSFPIDVIPYDFIKQCEDIIKLLPQSDGNLKHIFSGGIYAREASVNSGSVIVSKMHKTEHIFTISKGIVSVFSTTEGLKLHQAPYTGITKPGTKRLIYAHTDLVWTTYHRTDKKTVDEVEEEIIEKDESNLIKLLGEN